MKNYLITVKLCMIAVVWMINACQPASTSTPLRSTNLSLPLSSRVTPTASKKLVIMLNSSDSLIRYEVGNPSFRGRTTVEVKGDRQVTVRFEQNTQNDVYAGTLSMEEFTTFQKTLQSNQPFSITSTQTVGKPGEAKIRLTGRNDDQEQSTEFWSNEQWQIPTLQNLVSSFNKIATTISGGKVRY